MKRTREKKSRKMERPGTEKTGTEEAQKVPGKSGVRVPERAAAQKRRESDAPLLRAGERLDDLQLNGLQFIQDPSLFCFGIDAVLLSGFARIRPGEKVLDLCSGSGILPVLLSAKTKASHLTGLELFPENAMLAERNIRLNHLEERVDVIQGDVKNHRQLLREAAFGAVTCNPPYIEELPPERTPSDKKDSEGGRSELVTAARHEIFCTLDDVARAASWTLKSSGRFFMVHRPFRLAQIIRTLSAHHLEPKRMRLVCPFAGKEPNMVLVEAVKGGRSGMVVEAPLIVYREKGVYTDEILSIYGIG